MLLSTSKFHLDCVQSSMPVFGQNQFSQPIRVDAIGMLCDAVVLGAVDERHDVGILLNGSAAGMPTVIGSVCGGSSAVMWSNTSCIPRKSFGDASNYVASRQIVCM